MLIEKKESFREIIKEWLDISLKAFSIAAIIAGGVWAYYNFDISDTAEPNIQVNLSAETLPYDSNNRILVVHTKIKNLGKVPVDPDEGGITLQLKKVPPSMQVGPVELKNINPIYSINIGKKYDDDYELEPGVEFDEQESFVLPKDDTYYANAEIDFGEYKGDKLFVNGEVYISIK